MLDIRFDKVAPGKCQWCNGEKEEVFCVTFADKSFAGAFCTKDLMKAIRMKLAVVKTATPMETPPVPNRIGPPVVTNAK